MANKYVDVKVQVWQRLHFRDDTDMEEVVEQLKLSSNLGDLIDNVPGYVDVCEVLYDTETYMDPENNCGNCTIQVFDESSGDITPIWENT